METLWSKDLHGGGLSERDFMTHSLEGWAAGGGMCDAVAAEASANPTGNSLERGWPPRVV